MTKWSDFIRAPGTAGPPTVQGIKALGFALLSEVATTLGKYVRVDQAQTFTNGEKIQGRDNISAQEASASLTSLAGLATAADRLPYTTAANTWAVTTLTTFARTLLDDVDGAAMRATLTLGNVNNTSDANKPVSTAQQAALNLKANLASPPLTGTPTAPTAAPGTNTTQIATTAFVAASVASPFTKEYISAQQTITLGGSLTLPHGMGVSPKSIQISLVCITAENGYSINDELFLSLTNDNGSAAFGAYCTPDATNLNLRYATGSFVGVIKNTGVRVGLTSSNWRLIIRAWA